MDLLEKIRQHIDEFIIMIVVGFISMGIYILSEKDAPLRHSFRLALMGFLIAQVFSLPIYYIIKRKDIRLMATKQVKRVS